MKKTNSIQYQWRTDLLHLMTIRYGVAVATITLLPLNVAMATIQINGNSYSGSDYTVDESLTSGSTGIIKVDNTGTGSGAITITSDGSVKTTGTSNPIAINTGAELGTLTNNGTITAETAGYATLLSRGTIGTLNNTGIIEHTSSSTALIVNNATNITNDGTIRSDTGHAVLFGYAGSAVIGTFTNNGTITTNTSTITKAAIELGDGTNIAKVISFINTGNVSSTNHDAISIATTSITTDVSSMGFTNTGTISAARYGLLVNAGTQLTSFTNEGTITSSGSDGAALYLREDQTNAITNVGYLTNTSSGYGLWIDTADQTQDFTNSGTISSSSGTAMNIDSAMEFVNTGTVSGGGGVAIDVEDNFTLTNSGTITGTVEHAVTGALTITQSAGSITGGIRSTADGAHSITLNGGSVTGDIILNDVTANSLILNGATVNGTIDIGTGVVSIDDDFTTGGTITATTMNVTSGNELSLGHNITATTTKNAGTIFIAEGESQTLNGDYTQTSSGILKIGASSDSSYGKLTVTGTATLGDDAKFDVDVNNTNTLASGETLSGVLSAGTLVGNDTYTVTDNSALFNFIGNTNGNAVDLKIVRGITTVESINSNELQQGAGAATVFDDLIANGGGTTEMNSIITQLGKLATEKDVSDAVESTLPGMTGGVSQLTNVVTDAVTGVVTSRQDLTRGLSSGDGFVSDKHFWFKPFGGWTEQDDREGVTGYDIESYGLALGVDGDVSPSWNVGFALAYINSDVESNLAVGSHNIDMDSYVAKVYATNMLDDVTALNLQLGAGISDYDSNRRIFTDDVAKADYDSWQLQASVELERSYNVSEKTVVTPYVHADYSYVAVESYQETGAGALNLNVDSDSADSLVLGVGVKANQTVSERLQLMATAGIGYDIMTDRSTLTSSFAGGGASFTTQGMEPDELVYNAGLGAHYNLDNGSEIVADYTLNARQDYIEQSVSVAFRLMF